MAFVNVVFTDKDCVAIHLEGEIDLIGWESHWRESFSGLRCRETLDTLYHLQADKDEPRYNDMQRQLLQKLLAILWQNEGEVDFPVLLFGGATNFVRADQDQLQLSETDHFTLQAGAYHSLADNNEEEGDYVVEYLCLYAFQDIPAPISWNKAISQAWWMRDVAVRYLKGLRYRYGELEDTLCRPYSDNFPEPNAVDGCCNDMVLMRR